MLPRPPSLIARSGTTPARFLSCVIGTLEPGFVRVLVGPGVKLLDGGVEHDIPVELIPLDLRKPNCRFWIHFVNNHPIVERLEKQGTASEEVRRRWYQIHLSTAIMMMVCAGMLLGLNLLPVLHYNGQDAGADLFEITGYGWPFKYSDTGMFYGPYRPPSFSVMKVCGNVLVALALVIYSAAVAEWRTLPFFIARGLLVGSIVGVVFGVLCFCCMAQSAMLPVVSDASLSIVTKPWWQNWRPAMIIFMVVGVIVGTIIALRTSLIQVDRCGSV